MYVKVLGSYINLCYDTLVGRSQLNCAKLALEPVNMPLPLDLEGMEMKSSSNGVHLFHMFQSFFHFLYELCISIGFKYIVMTVHVNGVCSFVISVSFL